MAFLFIVVTAALSLIFLFTFYPHHHTFPHTAWLPHIGKGTGMGRAVGRWDGIGWEEEEGGQKEVYMGLGGLGDWFWKDWFRMDRVWTTGK